MTTTPTTFDEKLIQRGSQNSTRAMVEQAETSLKHATTFMARLIAAGLVAAWYDDTRTFLATVSAARGTQFEVRNQAKGATLDEATARDDGKHVIRTLKVAAEIVLGDGPVAGVNLSNFMTGKVGKSTAGVLDHLTRLRPHVVTLEEQLKPYFNGESPLARLDEAAATLRETMVSQAALQASAPFQTLALYEAQGRLLAQIERLNLIARIAFDGQAAIRALFNKDILLNARRSSRKGSTTQKPAEPQPVLPDPA